MAFLAGTSALSGDEDWRTWTLIKVVPERNWASLVRAREHAVLEGEVSERTRAAYDFYRETRRPDFDVRMSFMFMITRSGADSRERLAEWIRRTEEAERVVSGWTLSFRDFCVWSDDRPRFASLDLQMKLGVATALTDVGAFCTKAGAELRGDVARERFMRGVALLSEALSECLPEKEEDALKAKIESLGGFHDRTENVELEHMRFTYYRSEYVRRRLKRERPFDVVGNFLEGLEFFCGNDVEAKLRLCSMAGVRGKIDLTLRRRPELSDEAIEQYERRNGRSAK